MRCKVFLFLCVLLHGCASVYTPEQINALAGQELSNPSKVQNLSLCQAYPISNSKRIKEEIIRRSLVKEDEWHALESQVFNEKTTECALMAMSDRNCYKYWDLEINPSGEGKKKVNIVRCAQEPREAYFVNNKQLDELTAAGISAIVGVLEKHSKK